MDKTVVKKQKINALYKETFEDAISQIGEENIYYCGRKMYIRSGKVIISVEFTGTTTAFSNLVLTAMSLEGPIDQNITPLNMIFRESKDKSGRDKLVNLRMILNVTGEYTVVWTSDLDTEDSMALNNFLMDYVELFSAL